MKYHEVAGIVLIVATTVHILINFRTLKAMGTKFIKIPWTVKTGLIVDILLILCYGFIGISGVMISKTILTEFSSHSMIFRFGHTFAASCSVILSGIHIGLHISVKPMNTLLAASLTVLVLTGGIWGILKSNELQWLTSPFSGKTAMQENHSDLSDKNMDFTQRPNGFNQPDLQTSPTPESDGSFNGENNRKPDLQTSPTMDSGQSSHKPNNRQNHNQGNNNNRKEFNRQQENQPQSNPVAKENNNTITPTKSKGFFNQWSVPLMFGSMILSCTMITYWVVILTKKKKTI